MSCFSWPDSVTQQYYTDIKCYRFLNNYQRIHVIMCRCGKFPHVLGSTSPGAKIFKYYWEPYCIFCLECENQYNKYLCKSDSDSV